MASDSRLVDLCEEVVDCPHSTPRWTDSGATVLRSHNIRNGRLDLSNRSFTDEANFRDRIRRAQPREGDLVITREAPMGEVAMIPAGLRCCLGQRMVLLRPDPTKVDPRYLLYALQSPQLQYEIGLHDGTGSTVSNLRIPLLESLPIPTPPLTEQRRIASTLGALDDKIELDHRMSQTLESMARALFKSWFIDFDPARAKSEGRDPGLPATVSELFPAAFVDSSLGDIPSGWHIGRLGDVLDQRVERCTPSAETASRPYVPIECISPRSLALVESRPGVEAQSSLIKFYQGDVLFGAMRPYFHKVCIAPFDGTTRTTAFVLHPRLIGDFAFAAFLLHDAETIDYATQHSTGSTIPYAVWEGSLKDMPIVLPSPGIRSAFDVLARPLLARLRGPYFQDQALTSARETLLPGLLSGDLDFRASA